MCTVLKTDPLTGTVLLFKLISAVSSMWSYVKEAVPSVPKWLSLTEYQTGVLKQLLFMLKKASTHIAVHRKTQIFLSKVKLSVMS